MFKKLCLLLLVMTALSCLEAQDATYVQARADGVNVRACHNTDCRVITQVKAGTSMKVLGVSRYERMGNYGENAWLKVEVGARTGFVYGAVVVLDVLTSELVGKKNTPAYVDGSQINVRLCPGLDCPPIFKIPAGDYLNIIGDTKQKEVIDAFGEHAWQAIEYKHRKGYVFGGLLKEAQDRLMITANTAAYTRSPGEDALGQLTKGEEYQILSQTTSSEVRRPLGRNYWYAIDIGRRRPVWVYGGYTSKRDADVDCQCVDFVKSILEITGPTNNATDWASVLLGQLEVRVGNRPRRLNYQAAAQPKVGDIAVFNRHHPEAHDRYGHIGFVRKIEQRNNRQYVLIEGANQEVSRGDYYTQKGCHNVSEKWYFVSAEVAFFR